jgi:hypothetical protein
MRPSGPWAVPLNSADGPDAETELEMLVFQSRLCAERKRGKNAEIVIMLRKIFFIIGLVLNLQEKNFL